MADYGVSARFEELSAEFTARSRRKHPHDGYALIEYHPPFPGRRCDPYWPNLWLFPPRRAAFTIRYLNADGTTIHWGATVGHTKAGVISWLLRQRKAFP